MHRKRCSRRCLLVASMALIAVPVGAQNLMVTGYADFSAVVENVNSDESEFYFDNGHFNVIVMGNIFENVFTAAEVEYEHAGAEIELEYGYVGYTGFTNISILAGKFIVPFGRFNKDLHATWINKMPDRPNGFKNVFPQTYSDAGLWIVGVAPFGRGNRLTADAWAVNGLMGEDGGDIRGMRGNDREKQAGGRDNNKTIGTRLGLDFAPLGLDVGASIQSGNYSDVPGERLNLRYFGFDAAYRTGDLELRGEFVTASQEATGGSLKKSGGYVQAAYRHNKLEPVLRYSSRNMPDTSMDQGRFGIGLNFYVAPSSVLRAAYFVNSEKAGFETDNNGLVLQFAVGF